MLTVSAPAKINLYLHVTGKRDDGYHLLDSLAVFATDFADELTFETADHFSMSISGPYAQSVPQENLITKAVRAMEEVCGRKADVKIHLTKNIPAGAGLGGGSADAAVTVKGLEKFWNAPLEQGKREELLLQLGADVPVCYRAMPCRFQGIGEIIHDIPALPALFMLIVWPGVTSETKNVFAHRTHRFTPPAAMPAHFKAAGDFLAFLETTQNDLTDAAANMTPAIADALQLMKTQKDCLLTRMSGSGSAVFGLFADKKQAQAAENEIKGSRPGWFTISTRF